MDLIFVCDKQILEQVRRMKGLKLHSQGTCSWGKASGFQQGCIACVLLLKGHSFLLTTLESYCLI